MPQVDWTITGTLQVEDFLTPNIALDIDGPTGTAVVPRSLAGVRLTVQGSLFDNGPYGTFVKGVTDAAGHFQLHARKSDQPRKFVVSIELEDSTLSVREKTTAVETIVVYQSREKESGPRIDLGTRVLAGPLGRGLTVESHLKCLAWYVVKRVVDTLAENGQPFKRKFRVRVPVGTISGDPWARGVLADNVYITFDTFNMVTLIHEVMHLWNYQHNTGVTNWLAAVWGDRTTQGMEDPYVAFHEGFAEYAAWELMHLLWGVEKARPYTRHELSLSRGLTSLDLIERNWKGVASCLRMLSAENPAELIVGIAGDGAGPYADPTDNTTGCPTGQIVTFFDVLRVFSPARAAGWNTEWEVGNRSFGLRRFFRRASDILPAFSDTASQLMLDAIDPAGTTEIRDRCGDLLTDVPAAARVAIQRRARSRTRPTPARRPPPGAETVWRHPPQRRSR